MRTILIVSVLIGLLGGCAGVVDDEPVGPPDARLPISFEDAERLGGERVARAVLGSSATRELVASRMRLHGLARHGLWNLSFPERRADPLIFDGVAYEGICSANLRRFEVESGSHEVKEEDPEPVWIVTGAIVARDRVSPAHRQACRDWFRNTPVAPVVEPGDPARLKWALEALAALPAAAEAGRVTGCEDLDCAAVARVEEGEELTRIDADCQPWPEDGADAVCVAIRIDDLYPYVWTQLTIGGRRPAPGQPFAPAHVLWDTEFLLVH
jgi:hypothetical protein